MDHVQETNFCACTILTILCSWDRLLDAIYSTTMLFSVRYCRGLFRINKS